MALPSHRTVNRHEGRGDLHSYSAASGNIYNGQINFYTHAPQDQLQKTYELYREVLLAGLARPEHDRESLIYAKGKAAKGTCEWIEDHAHYQALIRGDLPILWISGGPGKGKTMISIFLTQQLETVEDRNVIYFFCQASDGRHSNAIYVLRSLLWQLLSKQPELTEHFVAMLGSLDRAKDALTPTLLWGVFASTARDIRLRATVCIVDGLDECDDSSRTWLADRFASLGDPIANPRKAVVSLRVIVVSRRLRPELFLLGENQQIRLEPDNDTQVSHDIQAFVLSKMEQLAASVGLVSGPDRSRILSEMEERLLTGAEGTFLWVGFVMSELFQQKTWTDIQKTVDTMPKGLPALYDRMLESIEPKHAQVCSKILLWVTVAFESLSVKRLSAFVGNPSAEVHDQDRVILDQITACGPLVLISDQKVHSVHASVRDYLLPSEEVDETVLGPFRRRPCRAHLEAARACIARILQSDKAQFEGIHHAEWSPDPFLEYACQHWPAHARLAFELGSYLVDEFPTFFSTESEIRDAWIKVWRHEWRFNYCLPPTVDSSGLALLQACQFGFVPWARTLLVRRQPRPITHWLSIKGALNWRWADNYQSVIEWNGPLHMALEEGHKDVIMLLLEHNAVTNFDCLPELRAFACDQDTLLKQSVRSPSSIPSTYRSLRSRKLFWVFIFLAQVAVMWVFSRTDGKGW